MASAEIEPRYVSFRDGARYSSLSRHTIQRLVNRGFLTAHRVGRRVLLDLQQLDDLLKQSAETTSEKRRSDNQGAINE
jgi:excisionase family DNA binding protein